MTDIRRLLQKLHSGLRGDVLSGPGDLAPFARDESIFSIPPTAVVAPVDEEDLGAVVGIAGEFGIPVTARGGGTSVAGQSIGSGIILDFSKYLNRILDVSEGRVIAQPGVVLDDLNAALAKIGRRLAPDPSSRASCTLGGMVGTNASGPHGFKHGDTRRHVARLRLVLSDGSAAESTELGGRFATLTDAVRGRRNEILAGAPQTTKNSSGYALAALLGDPPDFTKLLVGSEGTLALVSEIEMKTVPRPEKTSTLVLAFETMEKALAEVPALRTLQPAAIELVDRFILEALLTLDSGLAARLNLEGAEASLWVEWEGGLPLPACPGGILLASPDEQHHLWHLRSQASKVLQERGGRRRPLRCIEDGVVPLSQLTRYVAELRGILRRRDCDGAVFGHAGDAHIHVNPMVDVEAPHLADRLAGLMEDVYGLILRLGGSISGEHGDGILRSGFMGRMWGDTQTLFDRVKEAFDPKGVFNPDKKRGGRPGTALPSSLRFGR